MYENIKGELLDFIAQFLLALVLNCCKLSSDDLKKKIKCSQDDASTLLVLWCLIPLQLHFPF